MKNNQYVNELNELLAHHFEKIKKPKLERLNQIYKDRKERLKTGIDDYIEYLGAYGLDRKQLLKNWNSRQKEILDFRNTKIGPKPKHIAYAKEDCKHLKQFIRRHGNRLGPYYIYEPQPLFRNMYSSQKLNPLDGPPDAAKLIDARESQKAWGWPDEPFHERVEAQNTIYGLEDEIVLDWGYDFIPSKWDYKIWLKWNGEGVYWIISDDYDPHYPSEAKLSLRYDVYIGQYLGGGAFQTIWLYWNIFNREGHNIKESNWLGGFDYTEWLRSLVKDRIALVAQYMTLTAYSKINATAILDFKGWPDLPFWINFTTMFV